MLGRRKKNSDAMEAELRKATLKRLAEVVGLPAEEFETTRALEASPIRGGSGDQD